MIHSPHIGHCLVWLCAVGLGLPSFAYADETLDASTVLVIDLPKAIEFALQTNRPIANGWR